MRRSREERGVNDMLGMEREGVVEFVSARVGGGGKRGKRVEGV